nr:hypothetical protein [uncultured Rhodopila sp.]
MADLVKVWRTLAAAQHRRLDRIAIRRGASEVKRLFDAAHEESLKHLRAQMKRTGGDSFSTHQARQVVVLLQHGEQQLAARMAQETKGVAKEARGEALHSLVANIERLEPEFRGADVRLQIEEAARFWGHESILRRKHAEADVQRARLLAASKPVPQRIEEAFTRYSSDTIADVEKQMALSVLENETPLAAIDRVSDAIDGEWWRAERIVRTESAYAFNEGHREGIEEAATEVEGLGEFWSEYCDEDGEPLDERVAVDSIAMTSQVAYPGGVFVMPPRAPFPDAKGNMKVPNALAGESWPHPPNRPNDRSALLPFSLTWGVPGWIWKDGRRVPIGNRE